MISTTHHRKDPCQGLPQSPRMVSGLEPHAQSLRDTGAHIKSNMWNPVENERRQGQTEGTKA